MKDQVKDHEIREYINDLRDIALEFHDQQQLRDRIAHVILHMAKRFRKEQDEIESFLSKYIILDYENLIDLSDGVNYFIRKGYQPFGQLLWNSECLIYIQPMVLQEQQEQGEITHCVRPSGD